MLAEVAVVDDDEGCNRVEEDEDDEERGSRSRAAERKPRGALQTYSCR